MSWVDQLFVRSFLRLGLSYYARWACRVCSAVLVLLASTLWISILQSWVAREYDTVRRSIQFDSISGYSAHAVGYRILPYPFIRTALTRETPFFFLHDAPACACATSIGVLVLVSHWHLEELFAMPSKFNFACGGFTVKLASAAVEVGYPKTELRLHPTGQHHTGDSSKSEDGAGT